MINNIFVKHETKDYTGDDMRKFKNNLIGKLECFDSKESLAKIESTYLNLKKIIEKDFRSLSITNITDVQLAPIIS